MDLKPQLIRVAVPSAPQGVVVVLHGGARRGEDLTVSPAQLSVLRMIPIARRIVRAGHGRLAIYRLLNSRRGWDTTHTPIEDVHWALREVGGQLGEGLPTCLVGHSLGGRAALLSAGAREVTSAVALAPWVLPSDILRDAAGKPILIVHGTRDRVASPTRSAEFARRLVTTADANVEFVSVPGGRHAMLGHHNEFSGRAASFVTRTLLEPEARSRYAGAHA